MKEGKVYLVGAGPGDASLLTLKAETVIRKADVILYDSLIGDGILSMIPETCRTICVGKRAGRHSVPQSETNRLILAEAEKGNCVVRLKGGDPFLFGRGGEELELLAERGVPFEIVPGITSPIAVPAYNGIPVTHRGFASSLHIITAHRKEGSAETIDFASLAKLEGTLVFLMGAAALQEICSGLIHAGMPSDTSAAILEKGTTAAQRRVVATLETLPEESRAAGIGTPAIILVGGVCGLSGTFAWAEKRPLAGEKILLMRPRHLIQEFAGRLRDLGAEVLTVPLISTECIPDNRKISEAVSRLSTYDWVVFTSPTGVRLFFETFRDLHCDVRALGSCRIAVIGDGSRRELEKRGLYADLIPAEYNGAALGKELASRCSAGTKILIPRAKKGSIELIDALREFEVDDIPLYETKELQPELFDLRECMEEGNVTMAVFTSASMVRSFASAAPDLDFGSVRAACIGEQTAAAARSFGMQVFVAEQASLDSLEQLILQMHLD